VQDTGAEEGQVTRGPGRSETPELAPIEGSEKEVEGNSFVSGEEIHIRLGVPERVRGAG